MWGWALAAARAGVKHTVLRTFQAEPGGYGIADIDRYHVYHYTFDLKVDKWEWSKRKFGGQHPQKIADPPRRALKSVLLFVKMFIVQQAFDSVVLTAASSCVQRRAPDCFGVINVNKPFASI